MNFDDSYLMIDMEKFLSDVNFKAYWQDFPDGFRKAILDDFLDTYSDEVDFDLTQAMQDVFPSWLRNKLMVSYLTYRFNIK